ncbi:MAG TPA: cytochrome C oxidase subunit IV family protein [Verrucomicrobia bacterium]|nr:cytochrome C oxidase subunit IV family protein [Verrucomicrobiota bacterium]HOB32949.1 cytochrome C oxidase subunit IV family protein [Verrucomicrobiota bacterium]HOP97493.1 cytochrome C oxidase subunit IV family protein [Verrucomicrobiota bacterium]HPU56742.1 cytochrome C oxidase subunit IV family protein [Verrucomicrobiota bacterium]
MSEKHHDEHFGHHVRRYLLVFYALLLGTAITVAVSYVPFTNHALNIGLGLVIAGTKAFLVAGYFMHLISERKMIYAILAFTVFFFVGLMFLTVWSFYDFPPLTITR